MKTLSAVLLAVTLLFWTSANASTCGCVGLPADASDEVFMTAVTEEYKRAAAIFTGEVIAQEYRPVEDSSGDNKTGKEVLTIKLAAERWWKGDGVAEVTLYTNTFRYPDGSGSSTSCEYNFVKGEKYLVFAFGNPDKLSTHACARTKLIKYAERDIKALDEIKRQGLN